MEANTEAAPTGSAPARVALRMPGREHGARIHALVSRCHPLDLNSLYAYLLLCDHHAPTCVIAELDGEVVGFISSYRQPRHLERLFVWQVAVAPEMRGTGLASSMLEDLLARPASSGRTVLETTVSPSNKASKRMFQALARKRSAVITESLAFSREDFAGENHEEEILLSIPLGPGNSAS